MVLQRNIERSFCGALLLLSLASSAGIVSCAHDPQEQAFASSDWHETETQDERAGRSF